MYSPGNILYFNPFFFNDGTSKPKYFIVLHNDGKNIIMACLPSSQDFVPSKIKIVHGCLNSDDSNFNCYHFEAKKPIATNGWAFERSTFVYGAQIDNYQHSMLNEVYQVEDIEYQILGKLKKEEFNSIITCFLNSATVKQKFKRILDPKKK